MQVSNIVSALATLSRAEKRAAEKAAAVHHGDAVAFLDEGALREGRPAGGLVPAA